MSPVHDWTRSDLSAKTTRRAMTTSALLTTAATLLTSAAVLLATVTPQARGAAGPHALREAFSWRQINWTWPAGGPPAGADYQPRNNLPLGLAVWRDRLFLTVPRRKAGVPATLGYVDIDRKSTARRSPALRPYPNWETNRLGRGPTSKGSAPRITSTYRVWVDPCDRLWVVDTGLADPGNGTVVTITAPQILVFNLLNDRPIFNYYLKEADYRPDSFFAHIAVDVTADRCSEAFAYLPDLGSYAVVVFDLARMSSFRVQHHFFFFEPQHGDYRIAGLDFQWTDGVFSAALSAPDPADGGFRTLYFHALSATTEYAVSTRLLRNRTAAGTTPWFRSFRAVGSRGPSGQSTGSFLDEETGVLFQMEVNNHRVTCWNSRTGLPMSPATIGVVAPDDGRSFVYPSDVKVDARGDLWFVNNVLPVLLYGEVDSKAYNYHVFTGRVSDVIRGTVCEPYRPAHRWQLPPTPAARLSLISVPFG
ncbi:L-dopachrome tautomerase yellow-f2-like isoform X2 [Schistocerca gregaria]|uniref:L-dopachrome tautomerase yellow-f2-like isoform X2 n=1 Tax=Schistocerca gregaria TaxID=7010 RepID=UPI00211EF9E3|nr:L-dopachrome tautomerase yellow-f2-like isoform X2 [Schistocerca gregaria]